MTSQLISSLRADNDGKLPEFAWPGGYNLYYTIEGDYQEHYFICPSCANEHDEETGGGKITNYDINYENDDLFCEVCEKRIEPSYGND